MARRISSQNKLDNSPRKVRRSGADDSGDKTPLQPLAEIAASTIPFHPIANIFPLLEEMNS